MPAEILAEDRFGWRQRSGDMVHTFATGDPDAEVAVRTALAGGTPTPAQLAHAVRDIAGHFAVIARSPTTCCAIVDHCRSSPIFFTDEAVSNDAHLLRREKQLDTPDPLGVSDAAMAGFVTGGRTLFTGLRQLPAGSLAIWADGTEATVVTRYRDYMPTTLDRRPEAEMVDAFLSVLDDAIARTISTADGRPIWVPLSGGRDSRLLLAKFVEQGYDNLFAFTYGPNGNDEMHAAKIIAERLGVRWAFMASRPGDMRRFFTSPDRLEYWDYCDGLSTVPNFQDLLTLRKFRTKGELPDDAIVVNGQTGDFVSGGHIPAALMQSDMHSDTLFDAIVGKHFSLWNSLKTSSRLDELRERVFAQLGLSASGKLNRDHAVALYEQFEFDERQSKYVINGQRNYEFLGLDWSLPLWDSALVEFWRNVPVELKFRQKLFRTALARWDYCDLFRDFEPEVDQWSGLAKAVLIPSRLIRLSLGPARRDMFLRHMLYFGMYRDQYAPFGYVEFLKNARDLRNPVSLLSRAWLAERGLAGQTS
ncbi:MAG: asparagine synthase [Rhodospirillaceae bacterium]|jgi:asparagine synthase (glutamine-hydrolysing)|nr:asparagine synthase [Rhodospirillaceae bacterium]MBT5944367.1 asparagine synthase [Rhodospirillaceae bacterium]MBT6534545.1 asparagine synthase [Rhodospirillaceae bacterium]MBT7362681.1 asparagine synthase [Rhodospirillaceae bacterium]